ncbi:hypothetical protein MPTK1_5g24350 [Marchantia polymorpha subsp. ruderalis]|uniref:Uncharacterized protein n=2 Tax=Marchantia polymorpha TaxID=3197 RepID=A0AAF6BLS7_MARPO|nr:hypothetical protein MARPO_0010s0021 [Marchantia polymorpha]BBN12961.1 hypothetical protein Mp_5g24350 [Marchantia polymorpha subsp. ruderalis]|eukprot:PTQ46609.1 hypothetical protein MARPO_0010s0021 [Marchantia polymorpha]
MARGMMVHGVRVVHDSSPLAIMQSLDGGLLSSPGPVSGLQGNGGLGLKVGLMVAAIFIALVLFLGLCEKRKKILEFLDHKHARVGPVPEGVEFEDLEPAAPAVAGSAAQNQAVDQA